MGLERKNIEGWEVWAGEGEIFSRFKRGELFRG